MSTCHVANTVSECDIDGGVQVCGPIALTHSFIIIHYYVLFRLIIAVTAVGVLTAGLKQHLKIVTVIDDIEFA